MTGAAIELLGGRLIKLRGLHPRENPEKDYPSSKKPPEGLPWQYMTPEQKKAWVKAGGYAGWVVSDGLVVADIDDGATGERLYDDLKAAGAKFIAIKTPRGYQFIFSDTGVVKTQQAGALTAGGFPADFRLAGKGYIVLPSENTEGRFIIHADEHLDPMPEMFTPVKRKPSTTSTTITGTPGAYGQAALASELSTLAGASEGTRNDALNRAAFSLSQLVSGGELERGTVEAALIGTALSLGLSESEARATIRSGMEAGAKEPRRAPESGRRETLTTDKPEAPGETPEAPLLRLVSLENLEHAELNPSKYAIAQLYPKKEVILGGGHGGSGKTLLALIHAAHKAAGVPWFGFDAEEGKVVFFSFEDGAPVMKYRLKKICQVYGLPYDLIIRNLIILDGSDVDGSLAVETSEYGVRSIAMTALFDDVVEACAGAALVFIDNTSDCYSGNEIDRRQVRAFIRELRNRIARPNDAGVVLLAHIDKAGARGGTNENTYSGSTAWHNTVRARWALTAKKDGTVELAQEKLNLGKKLDRPIPLVWHDGVLIPDSNIAEGLDAGAQDDLDKTALLEAIEAAIKDGVNVPTARTGPANCHGTLERLPDLPPHLRGRKGRDGFYKALAELQREGALTVKEYTTDSRNVRQRFCVNSNVHTYTPVPPCVEPTKLTQGVSLVAGIALKTGTDETNETHDKPKLWILSLPDGTVIHTQPSDTIQEELVI